MSLREFWTNVRRGAGRLTSKPTVDVPRLDADTIERAIRGSADWLTPRTVAGFNEVDFGFFPDTERANLSRLVTEFRQAAAQVPPVTAPSEDQVARALPLFRDIVRAMEFDRYGDAEAYQFGKEIERLIQPHRPAELVELRFQTGRDSTGDPGIWIWGFLAEQDDDEFLRRVGGVRPLLDWASRAVASDLIPYISFRSVADQAELLEAGAE